MVMKRPTLADVAALAGVSKMTASRALRQAKDVSKANIERVGQAAAQIGYVGNPLATSMSSQRSNLVGVVVPSLTNIVFAEVLSGIADGLEGSGLQPVFGVTDYRQDKEYDILRNMLSWRPAGLIVTGLDQPETTRQLLLQADLPIVQIMDLDGDAIDGCVGLSHVEAGAAMAKALVGSGRRRFGYVGCALNKDTRAAKRLQGFISGLEQAGLTLVGSQTSDAPSSVQTGRSITGQLLRDCDGLDCIYFSNDDMAAGGLFHCIAQGISVPDTVALAGFNGLDIVKALPTSIATSHTPRRQIGETAVLHIIAAVKANRLSVETVTEFTPEIDLSV